MEIVNCKGCGRLYHATEKKKLCPDCLRELENKFFEVKQYIDTYPGASIEVVSQECEVSVKQIKEWVKEERLALSEQSMDGIACEQCGAIIRSGKFCVECKAKIATELQSALTGKTLKKRQRKEKDRMRFLQ